MGNATERTSPDALRGELRAWLADHLTDEVVRAGSRPVEGTNLEVLRSWNRTLADGGWAAPSWPVEHGGRGADVSEQLVYLEEMNRVRAPGPLNVIGVSNIAPAIMAFGTARAEGAVPRADVAGGRDLVAGHVGARCRVGSGRAAHGSRRGWRRLRHQRAEDLELDGPFCRLVPAVRAHGPDGEEAPGDHLPARRPHDGGHRGPAADDDHGRAVLRRALLLRCACPPLGDAWPAPRGLGRGHDDAQPRARRGGEAAPRPVQQAP